MRGEGRLEILDRLRRVGGQGIAEKLNRRLRLRFNLKRNLARRSPLHCGGAARHGVPARTIKLRVLALGHVAKCTRMQGLRAKPTGFTHAARAPYTPRSATP